MSKLSRAGKARLTADNARKRADEAREAADLANRKRAEAERLKKQLRVQGDIEHYLEEAYREIDEHCSQGSYEIDFCDSISEIEVAEGLVEELKKDGFHADYTVEDDEYIIAISWKKPKMPTPGTKSARKK